MAEEQIRSVIGVTYVGEDQVQRYLNDLQRAGALTEATAARLAGVWAQATAGTLGYAQAIRELAAGLNQGEAAIRRFLNQFNNVASGQNTGNFLRAYNNDLAQLDRLSRQAAMGMDAMAQARRRLASAFAIQLGARVQDQMAGPVALAAANPRLALPMAGTATPVPSRDDRRLDRIMGALERRELTAGVGVAGGNPFASTNPAVEFERLNPQLRETGDRFRAINAALANLQMQLAGRPALDRRADVAQANQIAAQVNRGALTQLAGQYGGRGGSDINDFLRGMAELPARDMNPADRRLIYGGEFMPTHLRRNPDLSHAIFQAQPYELAQGVGRGGAAAPLPGGTSMRRVMAELQAEFDQHAARALEERQRRLYEAAARETRRLAATPLPRVPFSTLQADYQQMLGGIPGFGMPQLTARQGVGNLPAPWAGYGTAYGALDPQLAAGYAQGRAQAELERRTTINRFGLGEGVLVPGGSRVETARQLLAQQQVVPGTVTSSTTTRLTSDLAGLSEDARRAGAMLRGAGGDAELAERGLRAMGLTSDRISAAFAELAAGTQRREQAEREATQATQANTTAERANTAATAAQAAAFGPYRAGMGIPAIAEPPGAAPPRTFVAGQTGGAYQNLPAVFRPSSQQMEVYTGWGPIRAAQAEQARQMAAAAAAQAAFRQRLTTATTSTAAFQQRMAAGAATAGAFQQRMAAGPGVPARGGVGGGFGGGGFGAGMGFGGAGGPFDDYTGRSYSGGMRADFMEGFRGRGEMPYAMQLGQTFKFAMFYGAAYKILFAMTQTFQATLQEAIAFQDAMVDLNIATGETTEANQALADQLGSIATEAGFAPGEGVMAGARAIGLYGLTEAPRAEQELAARMSARTATMLAFGSGRPYEDIQADLGAIAQGYGTGYGGQQRVADLDAYLSRKFGIAAGSTIQPVAETAAVANLAGFSLEEATAISANLQSRTGQSASTIGGLLTQIFTRSGEGSLTQVAERYGISTRQPLRQQLEALGEVYRQVDPTEQARIASSFGRGRSQNVAAVLLGDSAEIFKTATEASAKAQGAAQEQFTERLSNIGGQLKQLQGDFLQFAKLLGEAGLLSAIGGLVVGFQGLFDVINPVLKLFASMPGPLNEVILGLTALAIAAKTGVIGTGVSALAARGGSQIVTGGALAGQSISRVGSAGMVSQLRYLPAGPGGQMVPVATGTVGRAVATGVGAQSAMLASRTGVGLAASAAGSALMSLVNPVTGAIAGLMAIGAVKNSMDRIDAASKGLSQIATAADENIGVGGYGPADLRGQASMYRTAAEESRAATGGFTNFLTFGTADDASQAEADWADKRAEYMEKLAKRLEAEAETNFGESSPLFAAFDTEGISTGLESLATSGASTRVQMDTLTAALLEVGGAATQAAQNFKPGATAQRMAGGLVSALTNPENYETIDTWGMPITNGRRTGELTPQATVDAMEGLVDDQMLREKLNQAFERFDVNNQRDIFTQRGQIADFVSEGLAKQIIPGGTPEEIAELQKDIRRALIRSLRAQTADAAALLDPNRRFTGAEAVASAAGVMGAAEQTIGMLPSTDYTGRRQIRAQTVRTLRGIRSKAAPGADLTGINELIIQAERQWGEARFTEIDNLRRSEQSRAKSQAEIIKIGKQRVAQMIKDAVKSGNTDALVDLIEDGGRFAVRIALQAIEDALHVARAAATISRMSAAAEGDISTAMKIMASPSLNEDEKVKQLQGLKETVGTTPRGRTSESERIHGTDIPDYEAPDTTEEERATAAQIAAARAAAGIAQDDAVGQARVALQSAQADLAAINRKDDPVAYWNAVKAVNDARHDYAVAQSESAAAARSARIAPDDAVAQAADDIATARDALALATPGSAAYSQALEQLNQAQFAYSQAQTDVANAAAEAEAARNGGQIAAARVQISSAARQMRDATEGTAAYYQALASYYQGQQALGEAIRAYHENVFLLGRDITNPLTQARAAMRTAARKLAADRRAGRGDDVVAQSEIDLRRAQAEVESTKFSQRLQAVQTAEDLGRISHRRYIRYLENEQGRLQAIKDRTFQQQQQLNEIDQALQAAFDQMQGQFNLGDIDTSGLVYQTRLAAAERRVNRQDRTTEQTVSIRIDGTDVAMVRRVLQETLGPNSTQTMSVIKRKV